MKHHVVRHPETSVSGLCVGSTDVPLSPEGLRRIPSLVEALRDLPFARIVSSDLSRCRLLAEAVATATGKPLSLDPAWREVDFGLWENRTWDAIRLENEIAFEQWARDFATARPPQGESFADLRARILAALPLDESTLIVAHAGVIRALACEIAGLSPEQAFAMPVPHGLPFTLDLAARTLKPTALALDASA